MDVDLQPTRTFDVTKAYAEEVKKVGKAESVPVVDAWSRIWEAAGNNKETVKDFLTDGLHLGKSGYEVSTTGGILLFRLYGDSGCRLCLLLLKRQLCDGTPKFTMKPSRASFHHGNTSITTQ